MKLAITLALALAGVACFVLAGAVGLGGGSIARVLFGLGAALIILALTRRLVYHGRFPW